MRIILLWISLLLSPMAFSEVLLTDLEGQETAFSSLKGKWVFINYWASWCSVCVHEIPTLNQLVSKYPNKVALFAVNYDATSIQKLRLLVNQYQIHFPQLIKDPKEALQLGDIQGVPMTFIFNPKGELSDTLFGGQSLKQFELSMAG